MRAPSFPIGRFGPAVPKRRPFARIPRRPTGTPVFLLDPDDAVQDALVAALGASGYDARGFTSAEAFLEAGPQIRPGCLVVDLDLPGMGGLTLLRILEARGIRMPAILTTGRLRWRVPAWAGGRVLEKPYGADELIRIIQSVLPPGRAEVQS